MTAAKYLSYATITMVLVLVLRFIADLAATNGANDRRNSPTTEHPVGSEPTAGLIKTMSHTPNLPARFAAATGFISRNITSDDGTPDLPAIDDYRAEAYELAELIMIEENPDGLLHRFAEFALRTATYAADSATKATRTSLRLDDKIGVLGNSSSAAPYLNAPVITDHGNLPISNLIGRSADHRLQPIEGIENYIAPSTDIETADD